MRIRMFLCFTIATIFVLSKATLAAQPVNRVTILYDAFGKSPSLKKDWGFSAFLEYKGEFFKHHRKRLSNGGENSAKNDL